MREVALYEVKNKLSALIAEIEESGEEIVVTRHGKPVARIVPATPRWTPEERAAWGARVLANLDRMRREHPESATPLSWEELKADMDEDR
jgi:prevent-host-death family protein